MRLLILLSVLFFFACGQNGTNPEEMKEENITKEEQEMLDAFLALPEVKKRKAVNDSISGTSTGWKALIFARPQPNREYYWVMVGEEEADEMFTGYFDFYFYPKTEEMKIFFEKTGEVLTLEEWRAAQRGEDNLMMRTERDEQKY